MMNYNNKVRFHKKKYDIKKSKIMRDYISQLTSIESNKNTYYDFDKEVSDTEYVNNCLYMMNPVTDIQREDMKLHPRGFIERKWETKKNICFVLRAFRREYDYRKNGSSSGTWKGEIHMNEELKDFNNLTKEFYNLYNLGYLDYSSFGRRMELSLNGKILRFSFDSLREGDYTPFKKYERFEEKEENLTYKCGDDVMEFLECIAYALYKMY